MAFDKEKYMQEIADILQSPANQKRWARQAKAKSPEAYKAAYKAGKLKKVKKPEPVVGTCAACGGPRTLCIYSSSAHCDNCLDFDNEMAQKFIDSAAGKAYFASL